MSDHELRDELLTLLVAGHETTATALAWAVERLVRHPDKLERLDRGGRAPARSGYLEAVVSETLRLRPVISLVGRTLREPMETRRLAAARRRDDRALDLPRPPAPRHLPEPERFRPERFLDKRARDLHVDPVRRRRASLHRRSVRPVRDAGRARASSSSAAQLEPARPGSPSAIYRRAITETPRHDAEVVLV